MAKTQVTLQSPSHSDLTGLTRKLQLLLHDLAVDLGRLSSMKARTKIAFDGAKIENGQIILKLTPEGLSLMSNGG